MGQIVKRKKKGRPSKADLARRSSGHGPDMTETDRRRSLRRRNVRYSNFIDFDDYLDDFEEYEDTEDEEEEDEGRKEKKLKLVLKLNNQEQSGNKGARVFHAQSHENGAASSLDEDEEVDGSERKPLKKRKIDGVDDSEAEDESENDRGNDDENDQEERGRKVDTKGQDSVTGTQPDHQNELPLPDKKSLELILDKLQKKDTYGVYAEPVDLEELPDYLDVIEHPMDFATVRKKLGNGSYCTLEQFENDVFLICSNAMQYNAPETIYHKQARTIEDLAHKKFQKIRIDIERSEKELKSEQKTKLLAKKQMKKSLCQTMQEPIGSDFSSGATLATACDVQNVSVATQAGGYERPGNTDGHVEGSSSLADNNLDKAEELSSGKGLPSKFGRKPSVLEENRRATYNISNQPFVGSESILMTFEGEIKQLVAVGLHAEYSYGRSLARFAASLGPIAWKVASKRIEQALPPGCKFGHGWVGEYEPLPTPVLMLETRSQKDSMLFTKSKCPADVRKGDVIPRTPIPAEKQPVGEPFSEGKPPLFHTISGPTLEGKPYLFSSCGAKPRSTVNAMSQQQNIPPKNFDETHKSSKKVELNLPPSSYHRDTDPVAEKQLPNISKPAASKQREMPRMVGLVHSVPSKQLGNNSVGSVKLPNGKVSSSSLNNRTSSSSFDGDPMQMARAATCSTHGQEKVLTDPVEAIRMSAEKSQQQHKPSRQATAETPIMPSVPLVKNDSSNAAAAAARAWMSIGAGGFKPPTETSSAPKQQISAESLYNPIRQLHPQIPRAQGHFPLPAGVQFQSDKSGFPFQAFIRPPLHAGNEGQFQNRPMVFPQFVATDLSRFQMQSPWRGLSPHSQPKQKQETLPPDLNIGFQPPASPAKQSSGVMVDSQQPDLALQL